MLINILKLPPNFTSSYYYVLISNALQPKATTIPLLLFRPNLRTVYLVKFSVLLSTLYIYIYI